MIRHRIAFAIAACAVIAIGLVLHTAEGPVAAFVADSLYTVLVYLILRLVFARARRWMLAVVAFAFSALVEVLQLTGLPEQWGDAFAPARLLLGASFSAVDLLSYAIGALAVWSVDNVVLRVLGARPKSAAPPAA